MAAGKKRGWLSRLLRSDPLADDEPALPAERDEDRPPPAPLPSGEALNMLFGAAGSPHPTHEDLDRGDQPPPRQAYEPVPPASPPAAPPVAAPAPPATPLVYAPGVRLRVTVHVATRGDHVVAAEAWAGERGSGLPIEGLSVTALDGIDPDDIEVRVVLHDGKLTPWQGGEAFCGSRGKARPLRGFALRLTGPARATHRLSYAAVFLDGAEVGPLEDGAPCVVASAAPLEALYIMVDPI